MLYCVMTMKNISSTPQLGTQRSPPWREPPPSQQLCRCRWTAGWAAWRSMLRQGRICSGVSPPSRLVSQLWLLRNVLVAQRLTGFVAGRMPLGWAGQMQPAIKAASEHICVTSCECKTHASIWISAFDLAEHWPALADMSCPR